MAFSKWHASMQTGDSHKNPRLVRVTVKKLSGGRIQVAVSRPEHNRSLTREYDSEQAARPVLLEIGIPTDALDFYWWKLLPLIELNEELTFPELEVPEYELWWHGFRFAKAV